MSTILSDNTVMVEMVYVVQGTRIETVHHVVCPGAPTAADLGTIRDRFIGWHRSNPVGQGIVLAIADTCHIQLIELTSIHEVGGPVLIHQYNPTVGGSVTGGAAPAHFTYVVRWTTGKSGRSYRGRTYMPGVPISWLSNDGLLSVARQSTVVTEYGRLITSLQQVGYQLVVCSKYSGVQIVNGYRRAIPRARGLTTPITGVAVDRRAAHLDRRKLPAQT